MTCLFFLIFLTVLPYLSYGDPMTTSPFSLIAHRGVSAEYPENTLEAFQAAIDMDLAAIELDVQLTKDGVPVVHHDSFFSGENEKEVRVYQLTFATLRKIKPEVPSLAEVLALDRKALEVMVELKEGDSPNEQLVSKSLEVVENSDNKTSIIIGSYSKDILQKLMSYSAKYRLIGIIDTEEALELALDLGYTHYALDEKIATAELVTRLNQKGHRVWVWTVDKPERARELSLIGVEGIITNDPRQLKLIVF